MQPTVVEQLANTGREGAAGRPGLRALLEHGGEPPAVAGDGRRHGAPVSTARRRCPAGSWTHIAATYDGTTERLFVGRHAGAPRSRSPGTILTSASPLRIGGNSIWSEWFSGLIDEVRIYNRALSAAEIQTDMNRVDQLARRDRAGSSRHARRDWRPRSGQPHLGRGDRQRRRRPLQRAPRHDRGLRAERGEPDRAADRHDLHRHRSHRRHLLLPRHRRGRRRQRRSGRQRGERHGDSRHDPAHGTGEPGRHGWRRGRSSTLVERLDGLRAASRATTSTAGRLPASRRAPPTGSLSRPERATSTPASPVGPTTTGSPPRTPPAT